MTDLVKIARSRIDGSQRTHWEGCERDHTECLIQRMADEIERLRAALAKANDQAEHFEREWYLRGDEIERLRADAERLDYIASNARYDPKMDGQHVWWPTTFKHALRGPTLRAAIDNSRKEKP